MAKLQDRLNQLAYELQDAGELISYDILNRIIETLPETSPDISPRGIECLIDCTPPEPVPYCERCQDDIELGYCSSCAEAKEEQAEEKLEKAETLGARLPLVTCLTCGKDINLIEDDYVCRTCYTRPRKARKNDF